MQFNATFWAVLEENFDILLKMFETFSVEMWDEGRLEQEKSTTRGIKL